MPLNVTWQITRIDRAGYSTWPSIAFSPSGQLGIAYFSSINSELRFATLNAGGTWDVETVDASSGDCAPHLRYRFSQPAISYAANQHDLKYALRRSGTLPWTIDTIAQGGFGNALAFDAAHRPGISYNKKDDGLGYTGSQTPSVWVGSTVDAHGSGSFNSIAFGPSGQPAIAYHVPGDISWTHQQLKYAAFDGAHWNTQAVGPGGGWCSLAFTPASEPAVTYASDSGYNGSVMYAVLRGGSWQIETVASNAGTPSLAFTPAGAPAISYHDNVAAAVKYAVLVNGAWEHALVEQSGKDQDGRLVGDFSFTSLAMSPGGQPAISYYDDAHATIVCAIGRSGGRWGDRWRTILGSLLPFRTTR